jgi:putative Holliday junction resolvase
VRWLGIDLGHVRIGLSISDELGALAHPYRTIQNGGSALQEIQTIVAREKIGGIVLGLPKNMDGSLGPAAEKAQDFSRRLNSAIPNCQMILWDERLTTVEAQRALHDAGKNIKQSRKIIDQVAAQILLQNFLDSLHLSSEFRVPGSEFRVPGAEFSDGRSPEE